MQPIDWVLVAVPIILILILALYTHRFVLSVADFLAGGRCAGRYLIANAFGESASGVANTMSKFEIVMISGFTVQYWSTLSVPVTLIVAISGFVLYRYRQTRALTLAQFFEMRYSRRFRLFMGMLAFVAGILNYGIFPAVSSRFFVYFIGLPEAVSIGGFQFATTTLIMASYLSCVLVMLTTGGQITLMVTDCAEGLVSLLILLASIIAVLLTVSWPRIVDVLGDKPANQSMLNPFDAWDVSDFNFWYVVMALLIGIYGTMAGQNTLGFNSAAKSPHEQRMAGILGNWRLNLRIWMLLSLTVHAYAFLHHPAFATAAAPANATIHAIKEAQIQKQMTITVALRYLLPVGIKGLFCAMMVMGLVAGDCSHIHSWGSIFVQDVVMPLRGRPLTTRQHLWLLRLALIGVAAFAFVFSLMFRQMHYIALWWQITNAIFISGAGAAIIGGLYWRRGTTAGAWAGVVTGASLALGGILIIQFWAGIRGSISMNLPAKFPLNAIQVAFLSAIAASIVYVIVSLITERGQIDLDRILHRGKYAIPGTDRDPSQPRAARSLFARIFGFDDHFTRGDKWIAGGMLGWTLLLLAVNAVVCAWQFTIGRWPTSWWGRYWLIFGVGAPLALCILTFVWFSIGGVRDTIQFFRTLKHLKRDATDDGRVVHHATLLPPQDRKLAEVTADPSRIDRTE